MKYLLFSITCLVLFNACSTADDSSKSLENVTSYSFEHLGQHVDVMEKTDGSGKVHHVIFTPEDTLVCNPWEDDVVKIFDDYADANLVLQGNDIFGPVICRRGDVCYGLSHYSDTLIEILHEANILFDMSDFED